MDANGILNVSASDKSTGKSEKITITNDKGRLSQEEIERMVNDADKFKDEDELLKKKIEAKNGLESYLYSLKSTLSDEKLKDKISDEDKESVSTKVEQAMEWLDNHQSETAEVYDEKKKEVEAVSNEVMKKLYAEAGGAAGSEGGMPDMSGMGGMPGGMPDMSGMGGMGGMPGMPDMSQFADMMKQQGGGAAEENNSSGATVEEVD